MDAGAHEPRSPERPLPPSRERRTQFRGYVKSLQCASSDIEALTELWLDAMSEFIEFYNAIPEELLSKKFDKDSTTALVVGDHVMSSALLDVAWCLKVRRIDCY